MAAGRRRCSWSRTSTTTAPPTSSWPGRRPSRVLLGGARGSVRAARRRRWRSAPAPPPTSTATAGSRSWASPRAGGPRARRSRGAKAYHWQALRPRSATATGDQRINSFGIGGEVELRTGLHLQKRTIDAPVVHFGLGEAAAGRGRAHRLAERDHPVGVQHRGRTPPSPPRQRLKGSCPWLFAWNGREMAFVTDLIWRSPLGLRINAQADGRRAHDRGLGEGARRPARAAGDGAYDLRVTAELWETHFFDLLSLLVVDHPQGTEVFVDERFAMPPPPLAVDRHRAGAGAARGARRPAARTSRTSCARATAATSTSRAAAPTRASRATTTSSWSCRTTRRATGRSGSSAQGWVHPTDSSINVAIGQGAHARPRGLSLQVADAAGRFRKVRDGLGFPSGKDKTVLARPRPASSAGEGAAPRSGSPPTSRSSGTASAGRSAGPTCASRRGASSSRRPSCATAGTRVTEQADAGSPERPRYLLAGTAPRWLDLEGYHTRFGDVRELLARVDDRYVIMNAGDEMRAALPGGARRPRPGLRARLRAGGRRLGQGRRLQHDLLAHGAAAAHARDRPLRPRAAARWRTTRCTARTGGDFETYHTRYVSPERGRARRSATGAGAP